MVDNSPQKECMNCEYYDDEQFVRLAKCGNPNIGIIHMNIRKYSKHRGELYAYLKSLQHDFDFIVLSENGSDASFYLSTILHDYNCLYELPKENNYGGVAIYVRQELSVSERSDLKLNKTCKRSKCNFKSVWINVMKNNQSYTIGGIYRHPGGYIYNEQVRCEYRVWPWSLQIDRRFLETKILDCMILHHYC